MQIKFLKIINRWRCF